MKNTEIRRIEFCNSFMSNNNTDSNKLFAEFIRSHPGLQEIWIPWNQGITDLTPVLELKNVEYIHVSYDMEKAISSLDGKEYGFELQIEGEEDTSDNE